MHSEFHLAECFCSFRYNVYLCFLYIFRFRLLIFPPIWESLDRIRLTLMIYFSTCCHCKKVVKSTSTLKSDNDNLSFKHSGKFPSMQSFELESNVCDSARSWAVSNNISFHFKLEFIPFAKGKTFLQTLLKLEECLL